MNGSGSDVEVKFGGSTGDLDNASKRAAQDIKNVSNEANATKGVFGSVAQSFKTFATGFKQGWKEAGEEQAKAKAEALSFKAVSETMFSGAEGGVLSLVGTLGRLVPAFAAVGGAVALLHFGDKFGDEAEKLDQFAQRTGIAATEISRWSALAITSQMSTESFVAGVQRLERSMVMAANGSKMQSAMFKEMGISAQDMAGGITPVLDKLADRWSQMPNGPKKTAEAMMVMGRAGANMIPILNQGSAAIKEQMQTAEDYGAVASDEFMKAGLAVDSSMDQMTLASKGLKDMLFEALAPAIVATADGFNSLVKEMMQSYRAGGSVYVIIQTISGAFKVIITVLGAVMLGFQDLWHVAVAALEGILGTIYSVGAALGKLLSGDFSGIKDAWVSGMKGTGRAMHAEFQSIAEDSGKFVGRMKGMWTGKNIEGAKGKPDTGGGVDDLSIPGMGPKGKSDKSAANKAHQLAEQQLRDALEALSFKQELAQEDFAQQMRLEEEKLSKLKEFYGADSREYTRELENKTRMERKHQQDVVRIEQQKLNAIAAMETTKANTENDLQAAALERERAHFDALDQLGRISDAQRIAQLQRFADQETELAQQRENDLFNIKDRSLREQLKLENLPLEEQRRINTELEQLEVEHQGKIANIRAQAQNKASAIADQAMVQSAAKWKSILDPISSAFGGFLNSMVTRSQSFRQALVQMGDQILTAFVQMGVQMAAKWALMELTKTSATAAGAATRTGIEASAAATGNAISASSALKQIVHKAAVAAAGAYAAIASIPVVGPFLAPAAAAAALYGVYKLASGIFSAREGSGEVGADGDMYQLHKKEMVLPAKYANPLRDMLLSPRASTLSSSASMAGAAARSEFSNSRGGDANFHYNPSVNHQSSSLEELLRTEGRHMRKWFKNEVRNGALKGVVS